MKMIKGFSETIKVNSEKLQNKITVILKDYTFNKEENSIEAIKAKLKPADLEKFNLFQEENALNEKISKSLEKEFQVKFESKQGVLLSKVNEIIKTYCKTQKIDVLLKIDVLGQGLGYYDESKDITAIILSRVK